MREEFLGRLISFVGKKFVKCYTAEVALIALAFLSLLKCGGMHFDMIITAVIVLALGYGALNIWQKKNGGNNAK